MPSNYHTICAYKGGYLSSSNETLSESRMPSFSTPPDAQERMVGIIEQTFQQLTANTPSLETFKEELAFVRGVEKIEKSHTGTLLSDYTTLANGVRQQLDRFRHKLNYDAVVNYQPGQGFRFDEAGHLILTRIQKAPLTGAEEIDFANILLNLALRTPPESPEGLKLEIALQSIVQYAHKNENLALVSYLESFNAAVRLIHESERNSAQLHSSLFINLQEIDQMNAKLSQLELSNANKLLIQERSSLIKTQLTQHHRAYCTTALQETQTQLNDTLARITAQEQAASPLKQLSQNLSVIREYQAGTKSTLQAVNNELSYAFLTWGFNEAEVLGCISNKLEMFWKEYESSPSEKRGKMLMLGRNLATGLTHITTDYVKYDAFNKNIIERRNSLLKRIEAEESIIKNEINQLAAQSNSTVFDLLDTGAITLPTALVRQVLERSYGERLTEHLFSFYYDNSLGEEITRKTMREMLICIAADVTKADLTDSKPVEHFRQDNKGRSILERYGISLNHDKKTVAQSYLDNLPRKTDHDHRRINALQVLADIESGPIWHQGRVLRMDDKTMYTRLQAFVNNPSKTNVFNYDRYMNFLTIASTLLVLSDKCKTQPELIDPYLKPCIIALQQNLLDVEANYSGQTVPLFKAAIARLIDHLTANIEHNTFDYSEYGAELFTHPYQISEMSVSPWEITGKLRSSEYLARKVAYWNKYYLENSQYLDNANAIKEGKVAKLREGTLFHLFEEDRSVLYEVRKVVMDGGLVCQVCTPLQTEEYTSQGKPIPVKVVFQGTIGHSPSLWRDSEPTGPGASLWVGKGYSAIQETLEAVMKEELQKTGTAKFAFETTGHSLGGADSQNCASYLAKAFEETSFMRNHLHSIAVTSFNTAGVTGESAQQFAEVVNAHPEILQHVTHSLVNGDIVQVSGTTKLGSLLNDKSKVFLVEGKNHANSMDPVSDALSKHCDFLHANGQDILPLRILHSGHNPQYGHYFRGVGQNRESFFEISDQILHRNALTNTVWHMAKSFGKLATGLVSFSTFRDADELKRDLNELESDLSKAQSSLKNSKTKEERESTESRIEYLKSSIELTKQRIVEVWKLSSEELAAKKAEAALQDKKAKGLIVDAPTHLVKAVQEAHRDLWTGGIQLLDEEII